MAQRLDAFNARYGEVAEAAKAGAISAAERLQRLEKDEEGGKDDEVDGGSSSSSSSRPDVKVSQTPYLYFYDHCPLKGQDGKWPH